MNSIPFPATTTDGETVMIVEKAYDASRGKTTLTDEDGNVYVATADSILIEAVSAAAEPAEEPEASVEPNDIGEDPALD